MRILMTLSLVLLVVGCEAGAEPPAAAGGLQIGTTMVDYGAAMSPAGDYAKALFSPEAFAENQHMVVTALVRLEDGNAVQELTLLLFPVGDEGPELILGASGGFLSAGNPKAASDADGRLTLTTGPLWEFIDRFTLGVLHQRSPDRPFDLAVLPLADENGMITLEANEQRREVDLGEITFVVSGVDVVTE